MKKFLLFFVVLLISVPSSFAYQQVIYAGPPVNYNGMTLNINANCSYVLFECSWSPTINGNGAGSAVAYGDILIGEYYYDEGSTHANYSSGVFTSRFWGTVQVYLAAYNCYGEASLEWMP
jgi:hypothetical protein